MAVRQLLSQLWGPTSLHVGRVLLAAAMVLLLAHYLLGLYRKRDRSGVPVVGWVSPVQPKVASLWYIFRQKMLLDEAYEKYLKHGIPCRIPDFAFGPNLVLLPMSELKWVISQPETVLDSAMTQRDVVRTAEVLWDGDNPYGGEDHLAMGFPHLWISQSFNRPKDTLYRAIQDCLDRLWGADTDEWRLVSPTDTVFLAVKQAAYAVFLGPENSYAPDMWRTGQRMGDAMFVGDYLARCVPKFLRAQALWVTGWYARRLHKRFRGFLAAMVVARMATLARDKTAGLDRDGAAEPTLLDTLIREETDLHQPPPGQPLPPVAVERIVRLLTGIIFSTSLTTSIMGSRTLDLLVRTASPAVRQQIRHEAESALAADEPVTKSSVARLAVLDSALRECMRLDPFEATNPIRTLRADCRLAIDGAEYRLRAGTRVSFASGPAMRDPAVFAHPDRFDPLRFARTATADDDDGGHAGAANAFHALGYDYLAWGHGRTACPGRLLASDMLKLILADMFLRYDMRPEKEGPGMGNARVGPFLKPDWSVKLFVRRRKGL